MQRESKKKASKEAKAAKVESKGSNQAKSGILRTDLLFVFIVLLISLIGGFYYTNSKGKSENRTEMSSFNDDNDESVEKTGNYIPKGANPEGKPREAEKACVDRHEECKAFKKNGECTKNPGWMIVNCPKSCNSVNNSCKLRDPKVRCDRTSLNISTDPIYRPGDMNSMFRSLKRRFGDRYNVQILSEDPWVASFENFVSDDEADALFKAIPKFERSTDSGSMNDFGEVGRVLSTGRTSSNGWCNEACTKHPKVKSVMRKIEEVTGVPRQNYESFQVLKYELGQKYDVHHDYGADDVQLACGPRILTFFLYLSDVEEGGETAFPSINLAIKPKKGKAILWPSTLDHDPEAQDIRTMHEARPVKKGLKLAANSWIHLYDYEKPNLWGCTGSFDEL